MGQEASRRRGRGEEAAARGIGVTTRPLAMMIGTGRGSTRIGRTSVTMTVIGMMRQREGRTCATSVEVRLRCYAVWWTGGSSSIAHISANSSGYGHIAVMCPSRQGAANSDEPPCYKCSGKGHRASMCPNLYLNRDICYRCGMPGHIARYECSLRPTQFLGWCYSGSYVCPVGTAEAATEAATEAAAATGAMAWRGKVMEWEVSSVSSYAVAPVRIVNVH
jgi:hypothetical protein